MNTPLEDIKKAADEDVARFKAWLIANEYAPWSKGELFALIAGSLAAGVFVGFLAGHYL